MLTGGAKRGGAEHNAMGWSSVYDDSTLTTDCNHESTGYSLYGFPITESRWEELYTGIPICIRKTNYTYKKKENI